MQQNSHSKEGSKSEKVLFFPHDGPASEAKKRRVAIIGTYTPRKCGIATFTNDLSEQLRIHRPNVETHIYALDDAGENLDYDRVERVVQFDDVEAYRDAANAINDSGVDAVWLQHEYGIFGGENGQMVCDFVDRLAAPVILTCHTVLSQPTDKQKAILEHLVARSSRIMVMSHHSRDLLASVYGAPHDRISVIEHGAPDRPFGRQKQFKETYGLDGRDVMMTFGLIGPGKGLERVIEALPAIAEACPNVLYRIVGATHPKLVARQGESYREGLKARIEELGMSRHVEWDNRFLETDELLDQLEACDVYLTPYGNLQQSTSGTLSYAVALGKAVVSTPYTHATELLSNDVGVLIEPNSSDAIAAAVIDLFDDREKLRKLQERAYAKGRETIWPQFARKSANLIEAVCEERPRTARLNVATMRTPDFSGVRGISDATGILQHSIGPIPDRRHGYCLDDNARALMLMNVAEDLAGPTRREHSQRYGSFIQHAWNEELGRFRNFMNFDRTWCEDEGSEDSNGRTLWALAQTAEINPQPDIRNWAAELYCRVLPRFDDLGSPRAIAFSMLGACAFLRRDPDHGASLEVLRQGVALLRSILAKSRRPDWTWFEAVLGYDNPRLPQALIEAASTLGDEEALSDGLHTLRWIEQQQTSAKGHFRPIGSESFGREHDYVPFDQQPLEASASIDAHRAAYRITGDEARLNGALKAWNWFFGANDRGVVLADVGLGICHDGITPRGLNENCGAESILAFQLAHYSVLEMLKQQRAKAAGEQFEVINR